MATLTHTRQFSPIEEAVPGMPPEVLAAAKEQPKVTDNHVFFFGYEGTSPYLTFSQWYPADFDDTSTNPPTTFPTTEHYMMYHKALVMGDNEIACKILCAKTPGIAKTLGRKVKNFDQAKWDAECDGVVERANWLKFNQNYECKKALLASGNRRIVEASPNDKIWGVGFSISQADGKQAEWGQNKLGNALERVRAQLRGEHL